MECVGSAKVKNKGSSSSPYSKAIVPNQNQQPAIALSSPRYKASPLIKYNYPL
ncbi:hypothetical protein VB774_04590 [Pseudanabaena galeata UHCC 0370]|uniref:Uncharacterized protein n=1 Tax=Pseudanabaena galeata UHCC 0370 TaxID=3110310 RepID=A0ABU5TF54_9CYAN|nr:hypothetical protein [Pseudanabaena galeata]MEA5476891.1 hypothetical protein [Pseudanabaena galeata UHCC 0370]